MDTKLNLDDTTYVTFSTLPIEKSAVEVLSRRQKLGVLSVLLVAAFIFFLSPKITLIGLITILSLIYFADMIFSFLVIRKSLRLDTSIKFTPNEIANLDDVQLPLYTILCPLYKEADVLPGFLYALGNLDWPKNKLQVLLLLEEDDYETLRAASELDLPFYVHTIVIPNSQPKTKPKACNLGLNLAHGEYLVVYDAEDVPESDQLKKAFLGYHKVGNDVKCLQAKLNFFNSEENVLTRLFASEYSLWFDLVLPGLQGFGAFIPLGGTSNHFRTKDLRALAGWDPFNVTEDCDLGARIFDAGFKTAIIDSTTQEEANSDVRNWLRQRSRWVKGYVQTYLVHTRRPWEFFKRHKLQSIVFQLVIGARAVFLIINPILWLMTISYFVLHKLVGAQIEALYPPYIFYIAVTTLVAGNFLYLYYYMIGCAVHGQMRLIKYVFLMPLYWMLGSVSAAIAFYQLVVKPHYWEKTQHGLTLKNPFLDFGQLTQ